MTTPAQDQAPTLPKLPESKACLWVTDNPRHCSLLNPAPAVVNAFPWPAERKSEKDRAEWREKGFWAEPLFTADQMHAYVLADRASQAALVAEPQDTVPRTDWESTQANLLNARKLVCDLWESYPAVRPAIEARTGPWFVWGADRDTGYAGRNIAPPAPAQPQGPVDAAPVAQPASGEVQAGFIQFEGVDDTTEVMNAKALLRGLGFTVSPGPARVDGAKLLAKSIARHAVAWSEAQAATPTEPLVEQAPQEIPGLGRMSDDDGGFITLQFIDEAAAQAFMMSHGPSVEVDSMPPMRAEQAPQVEASEREDALSHLQHALKLADRMGGGEIAHSVQCAIRALATPSAPALAEPSDDDLRQNFTLKHGGPNPYYECKHCHAVEPGLREYLVKHMASCARRAGREGAETQS